MINQTKTIFLSNYYPDNNSSFIKNITIESGTRVNFDLSNIINENSNKLGIYKTFFDFGDGNTEYYNSKLVYDSGNYTFKQPDLITHDYFFKTISSPSTGQALFYYKNGNTFNITLSIFFSELNNIDLQLIGASNNSFISLSADTLIGFFDKQNNYFNSIIQNSRVEDLIINIPTVVTTISTFPLVQSITRFGLSATDPDSLNTTDLPYHGFDILARQYVQYLLNTDGSITNVEIIEAPEDIPDDSAPEFLNDFLIDGNGDAILLQDGSFIFL